MTTFAERLREDRRLVILRILSEQNGYTTNSSILHGGLAHLGVVSSRDDVLTDLHWLRDQSLVKLNTAAAGVEVATLTSRGQDVANGHATVPGVSRPSAK